MRNTTLIYIQKNDNYLMLHRTKKKNDQSHDKWLGIGGKFEDKESPEDCVVRETKEETGLTLTHYKYRGIVTFVSDIWETEYMHLFTADGFTGNLIECDEGDLEWIPREQLLSLPAWEGDKIFLNLLFDETQPFFSLKFIYEGDRLTLCVQGRRAAALGILALSGANGSTTASGLFVRSMVCAFGAPGL